MVQRLIVEGDDDIYVIAELCKKHLSPPKGYETRKKFENEFTEIGNGINEVLKIIPAILNVSGLTNFGIVVDADSDLKASWNSIKDILSKKGYKKLSANPTPTGTIIEQAGLPKVGVWIMPNNKDTGYLEHFVSKLVPAKDKMMPRAEKITQDLLDKEISLFKPKDKAKAEVHTWLAWQESPGTPMGSALNYGYLDANADAAKPFIEWMKKTFIF